MRRPITALFLLLILVLAACTQAEPEPGAAPEPAASPTVEPTAPVETPEAAGGAAAAIEAARAALAARENVPAEEIELVSSEPMEWTDSCLGLGGPAESCLQVITPGWLVILRLPGGGDTVVEARTDQTGETVRFQETADPATELPVAAVRAREELAAELGVDLETVQVLSFEQEEWPDSCLGMAGPDEMCLQVITPGWRILLSANGETYEVHTDRTGDSVRIGSPGKQD